MYLEKVGKLYVCSGVGVCRSNDFEDIESFLCVYVGSCACVVSFRVIDVTFL